MEEIAAEAVVSKPTLYEAFGNKDAALAAAIRLANGTATADLRRLGMNKPDWATYWITSVRLIIK